MRGHFLALAAAARGFQLPGARRTPTCRAVGMVPDATPAEYERVYAVDCAVGAGLDENLYNLNRGLVTTVKGFLDVFLAGRDIPRFYVLETLARMPYCAYVSVLHLRETLGDRDADHVARMRVHVAEADNELHHLLMMEALGGNASGVDRCLARGLSVGYYVYCCGLYATNRRLAYHLSELIEAHAYETYDEYLGREGDRLKARAAPRVIRDYYASVDGNAPRTLYDAFARVRDDEQSHWEALTGLVQFDSLGGGSVSTPPCAGDDEACLASPDECLVPAGR